MIDYILSFPDIGTAQRDPIVGTRNFFPVLLYHLRTNSVTPLSGYWCLITTPADAALASHPNTMIISDNALFQANKPSVISAKIDTSDIQIVKDTLGNYVAAGLQVIAPG